MPLLVARWIFPALCDQLFVERDVFVVHEWLHFDLPSEDQCPYAVAAVARHNASLIASHGRGKSLESVTIVVMGRSSGLGGHRLAILRDGASWLFDCGSVPQPWNVDNNGAYFADDAGSGILALTGGGYR